ncbi:hypothetical protein [Klenkia sp. PcliD-1-E]|uniref:hypothetical protein n=1 Tax=Klenkia sp. PcliD-1-E TaxID=2954492 RepID=UPI00209832FA|nr:hypothetical protein [Klenkia sp. PcliD-1-E]MCO7221537.1 hypothetical protein [Klenkia sp. PcliD-1-E]
MLTTLPTAARADGNVEFLEPIGELLRNLLMAFISPPGALFLVGILALFGFAYFGRFPPGSKGMRVAGVLAGCAVVALVVAGGFAFGWGVLAWVFGSLIALGLLIAGLLFLGLKLDRWARTPAGSRSTKDVQNGCGQVRHGA